MESIKLNDNASIPTIGLGTWQLTRDECYKAVRVALDFGYRHVDTADKYANHQYIAKAIKNSGVKREEIFITTKIWRGELSYDHVLYAGERFLDELEVNYIDLLLAHFPNPEFPIKDTLRAMDKLKDKGIIKSYGVSNYQIRDLKTAIDTGFNLSVNQVEFHPSFYQKELKEFCDKNNIVVIAYSPNGQGQDLSIPIIKKLARKYSKTESQIILNWITSKGIVAIPRSKNTDHIRQNFECLNFRMEKDDHRLIDRIGGSNRLLNPSYAEFD